MLRRSLLIGAASALFAPQIGLGAGPIYGSVGMPLFRDGPLIMMTSSDAIHWQRAAVSYAGSPIYVRDPAILLTRDGYPLRYYGYYWLMHTNTSLEISRTSSFALAYSSDLRNWHFVKNIDCSSVVDSENPYVWSPTPYLDDAGYMHIVVTLSIEGDEDVGFWPYEIHPFNSPFDAWSQPVPLGLEGLPSNVLGAVIARFDGSGNRYLLYKNETTKYVEMAVSGTDFSGYRPLYTGDWTGWGPLKESQWPLALPDGRWIMYMTQTDVAAGEYYSVTNDPLSANWSTPAVLPESPIRLQAQQFFILG